MRSCALAALVLVLAAAACGGSSTVTVTHTVASPPKTVTVTTAAAASATPPCLASALAGNFALLPGSAGAGQIVYRLRLTNEGDSRCFVAGIPVAQLLDAQGGKLPTNVSPATPGTAAAARVDLSPGDAATTDVRFSPDIPGGSEPTDAPCEPKAATMRLTIGAGTVDAPVVPPTPVCERGLLEFKNLVAAQ